MLLRECSAALTLCRGCRLTTWLLKNLAVFGIAGCAGVGCYIYLSVMPEFRYDRNVTLRGERPIFNPYTPATFSFFFGLVISIAFLHVFSMSVDTVLFSFLHDEQLMKEGKVSHSTASLCDSVAGCAVV